MTASQLDPDAFSGFVIAQYSSVAAFSFSLYDILLTSHQGASSIWPGQWTQIKLMYYGSRVASFTFQIVPLILYFRLEWGYMDASKRLCDFLLGYQSAASQISVFVVQCVLLLRLQAMYSNRKRLILGLRILLVIEHVLIIAAQVLAVPRVTTGQFCVVLAFPGVAAGLLVPPIIYEFILFVLGMIKFYQAAKAGWGTESVVRRFLRDGVWAFVVPFACLLTNTIFVLFVTGGLSSAGYTWVAPVACFTTYRLILNMSYLRTGALDTTKPDSQMEISRNIVTADLELELDSMSLKSTMGP